MDVIIDNKYRIITKPNEIGIEVHRNVIVDPTRSPQYKMPGYSGPTEPYSKWQPWKYASSVMQALQICANQQLHDSSATSLDELADEMTRFTELIRGKFDGKLDDLAG